MPLFCTLPPGAKKKEEEEEEEEEETERTSEKASSASPFLSFPSVVFGEIAFKKQMCLLIQAAAFPETT